MNDPLSAARSLRPLVEAEADATDRELTMTTPVIEALAESGLNHLQVPKELGGLEADVDTTLDVLEEFAHQDGSIGWVYMANANATAMCSMFDERLGAAVARSCGTPTATRRSTTPGCPRCWRSSCRATASRSRATGM